MPQIAITQHIAAPPAIVWAFISNLPRIPEWVVGTKQMLWISTAETQLGTEYRELTQIGPSTSETTWRVTTFHPPYTQTHESRSNTGHFTLTMTVEPNGDGTRLSYRCAYHMLPRVRPLGIALEALIHRKVCTDLHHSFDVAKRIIEQEYGGTQHWHVQPRHVDQVPALTR